MRDSENVSTDRRDDKELAAAIADGDRGALRTLYERHEPWLTARLRHRCADRDVLDECIQDTFVAVWKGVSRYDGRGEVAAWVWGIAIRRLVGVLRRRPRTLLLPAADALVTSAEDLVLQGVQHGDLGGALAALSPELRAVVQATVLDGLTTREAAALLGIPAGTVKTRMMRARAQLRGALT
jgi:RNA polymerase sigma-70 factor (ECF subfamily)